MAGGYVYGASRQRAPRPEPRPAESAAPSRPCFTPGAVHPAPPAPAAAHLPWHSPTGDRLRVQRHTCESCRDTSFEYGLIGGRYRIRRTVRRPSGIWTVHETPAVRKDVALWWWQGLLSGQAE
ncbi:hypothetical protein BJF79_30740 [Actinomadura sp. CNU-125]|uniref:hypothetical protein n=1 Tax=Actinomadura sp. CNU-125 TaxID=1904961 RepID=UPI00095B57CB|nr:hypothetical protein [Actinomadura sp. CNU-125]OLT36750.1 hypothetical protein BJF79_30740 [Actinomadura sp. CNU-125]